MSSRVRLAVEGCLIVLGGYRAFEFVMVRGLTAVGIVVYLWLWGLEGSKDKGRAKWLRAEGARRL